MFTTFHSHHTDFVKDYDHPEIHPHVDLHHDLSSHDTDIALDHGFEIPSNIELVSLGYASPIPESHQIESKYWLGNISVFLLFFGQIGWFNVSRFGDLAIVIAIIGGFVASRLFSWFIANYAKTVIVPIHHISRGDIGKVVFGLNYSHTGLVLVTRRDGIISSIIAKGAFPHDSFKPGDLGYIWSKSDGIYTITTGRMLDKTPSIQKEK
jgi:hypothetical protein